MTDELTPQNILVKAAQLVSQERGQTHGDYRDQHAKCASLWSAYTGTQITPEDVAIMMVLLKISRARMGSFNRDHYDDMAGYVGIAGALRSQS